MGAAVQRGLTGLQRGFQIFSLVVVGLVALALCIATIGAAIGLLPWIQVPVVIDGIAPETAAIAFQVFFTVFAVMLLAYMPMNLRVLNLETSHRKFEMRMEDIANAYWATHRADRTGIFKMKSEFDAVKERLLFLREHPKLEYLEPDILEVAAKMSVQSRELAELYSDEAMVRAKDFLSERLEEAETMKSRIDEAHETSRELRQFADSVEIEEDVARSKLDRLRAELDETLARVGLTVTQAAPTPDGVPEVIQLPAPEDDLPRPTHPAPLGVAAE